MKNAKIWPMGITIFYTCFVIAIVTFAVVISSKRFDLVSPEYYAEEMAYQDRIDSITRTKALGEMPGIEADQQQQVTVSFPAAYNGQLEEGEIHLYRPSDARQDLVENLALDASGQQLVSLFGRPKGLWQARLSWRMDGESYYYEQPLVLTP
ncbi:MAG: hypothetical protein ACI9TH_001748 [Kiritimatiellia bacterium]|jgi:hypothetical protein